MLGSFILFVIAAVVGIRRGRTDGKAIVAVAAISIGCVIIAVVGRAALSPFAPQPDAVGVAVGFLGYFLPLLAGLVLGSMAKKQQLKNAAEDDGTA